MTNCSQSSLLNPFLCLQHCFDRFTQNIQSWSALSVEQYGARLKCMVEQYDGFVDPDLAMNLNGTVTIVEDTADNGGIKLAYRAYAKWLSDVKPVQSRLIALDFTPEQLFWISYAQFYCTVQRKEHKHQQLITHDPHSFDRFRVLGPLMNSPDFARAFNCPISSAMNPNRERCAIWWTNSSECMFCVAYCQHESLLLSFEQINCDIVARKSRIWNANQLRLTTFPSLRYSRITPKRGLSLDFIAVHGLVSRAIIAYARHIPINLIAFLHSNSIWNSNYSF